MREVRAARLVFGHERADFNVGFVKERHLQLSGFRAGQSSQDEPSLHANARAAAAPRGARAHHDALRPDEELDEVVDEF